MNKLVNGTGQPVYFNRASIIMEAGFDTGSTSFVSYNDDQYTISQHECGEWSVSKYGEILEDFDDGKDAADYFMSLIKYENKR